MGERDSDRHKGKFRRDDAGKGFAGKRFTDKRPTGKRVAGKRFEAKPRAGPWRGPPRDRDGPVVLYGWHSVKAALENPQRNFVRENAARRLAEENVAHGVKLDMVRPDAIEALVGPEAVHQGLYAEGRARAGDRPSWTRQHWQIQRVSAALSLERRLWCRSTP